MPTGSDWITMSEEDLIDAIAQAKTPEEKKAIGAFLKRRLLADADDAKRNIGGRSDDLKPLIRDLQATIAALPSQAGRKKSTFLERLLNDAKATRKP